MQLGNRVFYRSDILLEADNLIGIWSTPLCKLFKQICFDILQKELWFSSFVLVSLLLLLLLPPAAARLQTPRGPTWQCIWTRTGWTSGWSQSWNARTSSTLLMLSDDKENEILFSGCCCCCCCCKICETHWNSCCCCRKKLWNVVDTYDVVVEFANVVAKIIYTDIVAAVVVKFAKIFSRLLMLMLLLLLLLLL